MDALVTGSSRGIGLAVCAALAARGDRVVAVCRQPTPGLEALGVRIVTGIDVRSDADAARLAGAIAGDDFDLVVTAAGIINPTEALDDLQPAEMLREYDVNALGAVRVVRAALPRVRDGGKIALVSSGTGASVTSTTARPDNYGYRMSKGALNVFGAILAKQLAPRISVIVLAPGATDTDMLRHAIETGHMTRPLSEMAAPDEVAPLLLTRIDELTPETSGRWIDRNGQQVG